MKIMFIILFIISIVGLIHTNPITRMRKIMLVSFLTLGIFSALLAFYIL